MTTGFNESGELPIKSRHLTVKEMEEIKKKIQSEDSQQDYYLNQPMNSDPKSVRAHMWMLD